MKRIFISLCITVLFICGCTGVSEVKPVTDGISFDAVINYHNEKYECSVSIDKEDVMTAYVTSPEDIKGLKLKFDGEKATAEFWGLVYEPKTGSFPMGNVIQTVYDILTDIDDEEVAKAKKGEKNCELKGKTDGNDYTFYFSPTGLPLSLEIPNERFKITFNNVTVSR